MNESGRVEIWQICHMIWRARKGVRGPASNHVRNTLQRAEIRYWKGLDITRTTGDGAVTLIQDREHGRTCTSDRQREPTASAKGWAHQALRFVVEIYKTAATRGSTVRRGD